MRGPWAPPEEGLPRLPGGRAARRLGAWVRARLSGRTAPTPSVPSRPVREEGGALCRAALRTERADPWEVLGPPGWRI